MRQLATVQYILQIYKISISKYLAIGNCAWKLTFHKAGHTAIIWLLNLVHKRQTLLFYRAKCVPIHTLYGSNIYGSRISSVKIINRVLYLQGLYIMTLYVYTFLKTLVAIKLYHIAIGVANFAEQKFHGKTLSNLIAVKLILLVHQFCRCLYYVNVSLSKVQHRNFCDYDTMKLICELLPSELTQCLLCHVTCHRIVSYVLHSMNQ